MAEKYDSLGVFRTAVAK